MCYIFLEKLHIGNISFIVIFVFIIFTIAYICDEIDQTLQRIAYHFGKSPNKNIIFRRVHYGHHVIPNQSTKFKSRQSELIRLRQIEIYRPYFGLWIFNLYCIDLTFVFGFVLFSINYIALITQTQ